MNRELRRLAKKGGAERPPARPPMQKRRRRKPVAFIKEVRAELGKVAWPGRKEVFTYTIVVLVTVAFFMALIALMDFISTKAVLEFIRRGGG